MARNPMGLGIAALRRLGGSPLLDRLGLRGAMQHLVFQGSRGGFAAATAGNRAFKAVRRLGSPGRPPTGTAGDLFDLTPDDDQAMLRDAAARFADERLGPAAAAADDACAAPPELLSEAAALGLAALSVPEELDGAGGEHSPVTGALIAEALAHGDMGLALACLAPVGAANALLRWGAPDQQAAYLAPFAGDEPPAAALAVTEPWPLFDPLRLETVAEAKGGGYVLDGTKCLVPRAADAEFFLVAARGPDGVPGMFVVERDTAGLTVAPDPGMGLRAAGTGRLSLAKARLPATARLGGEAGCDYAALIALSRLAWGALATGTAQAVLDYVGPYANERQAFGEPISHRQGVAFMISDIAIELNGLRLAVWRAAARAAAGRDFAREAALVQRLVARHGAGIGSRGVQILGGHGFVKEHPVERWYRDLRGAGVMEGGVMI